MICNSDYSIKSNLFYLVMGPVKERKTESKPFLRSMIDFCLFCCLFVTVIIYPPFIFHFTAKELFHIFAAIKLKAAHLLNYRTFTQGGKSQLVKWIENLLHSLRPRCCLCLWKALSTQRNLDLAAQVAVRGKDSPGCIRLDTQPSREERERGGEGLKEWQKLRREREAQSTGGR